MPKKREPMFAGELIPEIRGPGRPTESADALRRELRRQAALIHMARDVLEGMSIKSASLGAAAECRLSVETVTELWKAFREEALQEAGAELVALHRMTVEEVAERIETTLRHAEIRANRKRNARR